MFLKTRRTFGICNADDPAAGGAAPPAGGGAAPPAAAPPAGGEQPPAGGAAPPPAGAPPAAAPAGEKPWWDGVKEEPIREYLKTKDYKTPEDAARAAWNINRLVNVQGDVTAVLEGKATPEQESKFYSLLGRPAAADKYDLKPTEGAVVHPEMDKLGKELFYELGANPAKAQAAYDKYNKAVTAMNTAQLETERVANETAMVNLEKTWGPNLQANKAAGLRAMQSLKLDDATMQSLEKNIGVASVVHLLAKLGSMSPEGKLTGGDSNLADPNDVNGMTKEQASSRIKTLSDDAAFQKAMKDTKDPSRKEKLALWESLHAKAG